ncbi:MAG: NAD(P)H-binding protein [Pseudomonadota bacterium]
MMGASGAVGGEVVRTLLDTSLLGKLTLLGRRELPWINDPRVRQHVVDVCDPESYHQLATEHDSAVCTLGVGQPSAMTKSEFLRIDQQAVIQFATVAKQVGVRHFQLLGSIGASTSSPSFYLRAKGEL